MRRWSLSRVTARLVASLFVLTASTAWAQSKVEFTLELGGDNHATAWKSWNRTTAWPHDRISELLFTPGIPADGQVFRVGTLITWDVKVKASGTQTANPGAGQPIYGVANFVFNLELHQNTSAGPLANTAVFKSSINNGQNGDVLAAAAFPLVYDLGGFGPGRVVDPYNPGAAIYPRGGPECGGVDGTRLNKLKSATYPLASTGSGTLLGMGAGYNFWNGAATDSKTTAGIGMATLPNSSPGLGELPVCEGQIDTTGMAAGTYVLVLVPGAGINVLRGDVALSGSPAAFATAADDPNHGDTIQFTLTEQPGPPSNPTPADGATNVLTDAALTWTRGAGATSFDVCFGTTNPPPVVASNQPGPAGQYTPAGMQYGTQYFWQIIEKKGTATPTPGPVWSFTTWSGQPGTPSIPVPADGAINVNTTYLTLTWTRGVNATSYDVRLGTTNPPPLVASDQPGPDGTYTSSDLQDNTEYFWQIVEKNGTAPSTPGPVWRFTTLPPFVAGAWRSICSHGSNSYAVDLATAGPAVEPRSGGAQQIQIDFPDVTDFADFPVVSGSDGSTPGANTIMVNDSKTMQITFWQPLANGVCYTIDLSNVYSVDREKWLDGPMTRSFINLAGDTNSNGVINLGDALYIRSKLGPVDSSNARLDFNRDGTIDNTDVLAVKALMGAVAPSCP